jgi:hypothetical protein
MRKRFKKVGLYGIVVFVAKCRLLKSTLPFGRAGAQVRLRLTSLHLFFWPSTLLPGIVCACALWIVFFGCLWLWLGIASDRFLPKSLAK